MSLPLAFNTTSDTIPASPQYLSSEAGKVARCVPCSVTDAPAYRPGVEWQSKQPHGRSPQCRARRPGGPPAGGVSIFLPCRRTSARPTGRGWTRARRSLRMRTSCATLPTRRRCANAWTSCSASIPAWRTSAPPWADRPGYCWLSLRTGAGRSVAPPAPGTRARSYISRSLPVNWQEVFTPRRRRFAAGASERLIVAGRRSAGLRSLRPIRQRAPSAAPLDRATPHQLTIPPKQLPLGNHDDFPRALPREPEPHRSHRLRRRTAIRPPRSR